jgi:hypothetical protein
VTEPAADVSAQRSFEAELHLTTSDYREGLRQLPVMGVFRWAAGMVVASAIVLTVIGTETTDTEFLIPTGWLFFLVLGIMIWFVPDLFVWRTWRAAPKDGYRLRLDAENIAYTRTEASASYTWPLVRKAIETTSAFHLVIRVGMATAVCTFPKRAFPLEDHAAIRDLVTSKVGKLGRH